MAFDPSTTTSESATTGAHSSERADERHGIRERAKEAAAEARQGLRDRSHEIEGWVRTRSSEFVESQLNRAADECRDLSEATRAAASKLRESGDDRIAGYTEVIADNVESAERYFRETTLREMYEDAEDFARKRPGLVIGGLLVGGFALARFLRASRREDEYDGYEAERHDVGGFGERYEKEPRSTDAHAPTAQQPAPVHTQGDI